MRGWKKRSRVHYWVQSEAPGYWWDKDGQRWTIPTDEEWGTLNFSNTMHVKTMAEAEALVETAPKPCRVLRFYYHHGKRLCVAWMYREPV